MYAKDICQSGFLSNCRMFAHLRWIRQDVIVSIPRLPCHISDWLLSRLGDLISKPRRISCTWRNGASGIGYNRHLVFSFIHNFLLTPTLDLGCQANISNRRARHRNETKNPASRIDHTRRPHRKWIVQKLLPWPSHRMIASTHMLPLKNVSLHAHMDVNIHIWYRERVNCEHAQMNQGLMLLHNGI